MLRSTTNRARSSLSGGSSRARAWHRGRRRLVRAGRRGRRRPGHRRRAWRRSRRSRPRCRRRRFPAPRAGRAIRPGIPAARRPSTLCLRAAARSANSRSSVASKARGSFSVLAARRPSDGFGFGQRFLGAFDGGHGLGGGMFAARGAANLRERPGGGAQMRGGASGAAVLGREFGQRGGDGFGAALARLQAQALGRPVPLPRRDRG